MISPGPAASSTRTAAGRAVPVPTGTPPAVTMAATRLRRVRWGVRAALVVGVAASVAANILHADPHPVSQVIAAWPPLALLLTVELISRVPVHRRALAAVRLLATAAIAGIAAWVSYFHMAGVVSRYGETGTVPYLLPLSVDGLIIVASISLVELAGRIHDNEKPTADPLLADLDSRTPADVPITPGPSAMPSKVNGTSVHVVNPDHTAPSPLPAAVQPATESGPAAEPSQAPTDRCAPQTPQPADPGHPADRNALLAGHATQPGNLFGEASGRADQPPSAPAGPPASASTNLEEATPTAATAPRSHTDVNAEGQTAHEEPRGRHPFETASDGDETDSGPDGDDDIPATAAAIAAVLKSDPTLQPADVAVKINRSVRTVRRHWKTAADARPAPTTPLSRSRDGHRTREDVDEGNTARRR